MIKMRDLLMGNRSLQEVKNSFGIPITSIAKRGKSIDQEQLDTVSQVIERYKDYVPKYIDGMVANSCGDMTNLQIAAAYEVLGFLEEMKDTESVKRAYKSLKKKAV